MSSSSCEQCNGPMTERHDLGLEAVVHHFCSEKCRGSFLRKVVWSGPVPMEKREQLSAVYDNWQMVRE